MSTAVVGKGLEGIVAANSGICWIDGETGVLAYRGIDIHELAEKSSFEETTYLLWFGRLPNQVELDEFTKRLTEARTLDPKMIDMLRRFPRSATPMEVLRTAVSALSFYDPEESNNQHDANVSKSFRLTAQIAMLVAVYDRLRKGKTVIEPDPLLSHSANFLWMLNGEKPSETATKALDVALVLHADHELNASTFAARVIAATLSDLHSAITGAIGALKGPLHGGANEKVMDILIPIGGPEKAEAWIHEALSRKERIMGFGHRVYKTGDVRAGILKKYAQEAAQKMGNTRWEETAEIVERVMA